VEMIVVEGKGKYQKKGEGKKREIHLGGWQHAKFFHSNEEKAYTGENHIGRVDDCSCGKGRRPPRRGKEKERKNLRIPI